MSIFLEKNLNGCSQNIICSHIKEKQKKEKKEEREPIKEYVEIIKSPSCAMFVLNNIEALFDIASYSKYSSCYKHNEMNITHESDKIASTSM